MFKWFKKRVEGVTNTRAGLAAPPPSNSDVHKDIAVLKYELQQTQHELNKCKEEMNEILYAKCPHQYEKIATALGSTLITLGETHGLFSTDIHGDVVVGLTHHFDYYDEKDGERWVVFAHLCSLCGHAKPMNCFEIAGTHWTQTEILGMKYLRSTNQSTSTLDEFLSNAN